MGKAKKYSPEQFVNLLRQLEVAILSGYGETRTELLHSSVILTGSLNVRSRSEPDQLSRGREPTSDRR